MGIISAVSAISAVKKEEGILSAISAVKNLGKSTS